MKKVLILFIFFFTTEIVLGQKCTLQIIGRVTGADGTPIEAVSVTLYPVNKGAVSSADGLFILKDLCKGKFTLVLNHVGYEVKKELFLLEESLDLNFTLTTKIKELEAVIVHEESHEEGIMVSGLNRTDLDGVAGKNLGEALKEISGVSSIQAGPGVSKPVIHGVHGLRILILNNGVRLEGQQWGAEHAPEIDPFIASTIQVIKDASSIKHGVDAIGGVVLINPPALPEQPGLGGYFQTIGQTNGRSGTISGSLQGGIENKKGWGWRLQGTKKQTGDFNSSNYSLTNTALRETNLSGSIGYHGARGGFELFASHFSTDIGILLGSVSSSVSDLADAIAAEKPRYTRPFSYSINNPRQDVIHQLVKLNGHFASHHGTWRWMYAWQQNQRKEFDIRRGGLSELPAIDLHLDTHSIETEWEQSDGKPAHFRIGSTGMFQQNRNVYGTQRIPFIPNYTSLTGGFYTILNVDREKLKFDGGLRYDIRYFDVAGFDFKNTLYRQRMLFHNLSATAGLSIIRKDGRSWSTSLSSAWRPPHVAELFSLGTHQSAAAIEYGLFLDPLSNEIRNRESVDFKNEQSLKWVGSWKISKENFSSEVTGYSNIIFNYFYLRPGGITRNVRGAYPYFRYSQTNALFTGLDLEALWNFAEERMMITPRASLIYSKDLSNNDYLMYIPANRIELNLRREILSKKKDQTYFLEIKGRYVFRQFQAPAVISAKSFLNSEVLLNPGDRIFDFMAAPDGYFLAGTSAGLTIRKPRFRYDFLVRSENLFNAAYRDYTNRFRYYADELGRNIIVSFKTTF